MISSHLDPFETIAVIETPLFQFDKVSRLSKEAEDQLKVIPKFCFPDSLDWKPSAHMPRSAPTQAAKLSYHIP